MNSIGEAFVVNKQGYIFRSESETSWRQIEGIASDISVRGVEDVWMACKCDTYAIYRMDESQDHWILLDDTQQYKYLSVGPEYIASESYDMMNHTIDVNSWQSTTRNTWGE